MRSTSSSGLEVDLLVRFSQQRRKGTLASVSLSQLEDLLLWPFEAPSEGDSIHQLPVRSWSHLIIKAIRTKPERNQITASDFK